MPTKRKRIARAIVPGMSWPVIERMREAIEAGIPWEFPVPDEPDPEFSTFDLRELCGTGANYFPKLFEVEGARDAAWAALKDTILAEKAKRRNEGRRSAPSRPRRAGWDKTDRDR